MNVGLPLPWSNLTAILRMENDENEDGTSVRLTSRRRAGHGDEGLYLRTLFVPVRLPMHEEFRVWPADGETSTGDRDTETSLSARHEMWLFGRKFLTIDYTIERTSQQATA